MVERVLLTINRPRLVNDFQNTFNLYIVLRQILKYGIKIILDYFCDSYFRFPLIYTFFQRSSSLIARVIFFYLSPPLFSYLFGRSEKHPFIFHEISFMNQDLVWSLLHKFW